MQTGSKERVLITVKTYPHPSEKYDELVCTAGITEAGQWVRLYPINYRGLDYERQFAKYQWVKLELGPTGHGNDNRKESRRPNLDTLELHGDVLSTKNNWRARKAVIDKMPVHTLKELVALYDSDRTSLGIVRPRRVLDIEVKKTDPEWSSQQLGFINQLSLFDGNKRPLRKIPFELRYVFECDDDTKPHRALITDWELGALYLNEERRLRDPDKAAESVKRKFLNELCGPKRDTLFFMGTTWPYNTWIVLGVFYPERDSQLSLI
jgi:hypothetical protein